MDDGLLVAMRKGDYKYVYAEQRAPGQLQVWAEPFTKLRLTSVCISHIAPRSAPRWMEPAKPRAVGRADAPMRCGRGSRRVPDGCCQSASHMRSSRPEAVSAATATRKAVMRSCSTSLATWRNGVRNMGGRDMPDI